MVLMRAYRRAGRGSVGRSLLPANAPGRIEAWSTTGFRFGLRGSPAGRSRLAPGHIEANTEVKETTQHHH